MDEISRMEKILRGDPIEPITRLEIFCAMAAGTWSGDPLTPVSRLEYFLSQISGGGGGGETKSTLIMSSPASYTGDRHYTNATYQQFEAPEGIVYDKVWNNDEYCTNRYFSSKHVAYGANMSSYQFAESANFESICHTSQSLNTIWPFAFYKCTNLKKLALYRADDVVALNNINAFNGTPFASGGSGGTLYVPSALISSYQSASNWSTILGYANNSIQAIEGSEFQA